MQGEKKSVLHEWVVICCESVELLHLVEEIKQVMCTEIVKDLSLDHFTDAQMHPFCTWCFLLYILNGVLIVPIYSLYPYFYWNMSFSTLFKYSQKN